jgi:formate dehydrogenase alpha subunit
MAGAAMAEKEGAFTNLEGRIQSFHPVVPPPGKAMADWKILARLHARLNGSAAFETLDQLRAEIRQFVPMYAALDGRDEAWIEPAAQKAAFNKEGKNGRIPFCPVICGKATSTEENYPFTAIVGTRRYQLGSGTRTRASGRIQDFESAGRLEISPADAAALDLNNGDFAVVRSLSGEIKRQLRITSDLKQGHIFVPTGANGNDAMELFALSDETGWKSCAVQIEKA